jgi:hypothetical protein
MHTTKGEISISPLSHMQLCSEVLEINWDSYTKNSMPIESSQPPMTRQLRRICSLEIINLMAWSISKCSYGWIFENFPPQLMDAEDVW